MPIRLEKVFSQLDYRSRFAEIAWDLLANPIDLYKTFLVRLGPFGAKMQSFEVDFQNSMIAQNCLTVNLSDLGVHVKVRFDRLEVNFLKF